MTNGIENLNIPGNISGFGYELIRNDLLNDLLGKEQNDILYWAGKMIARKYPLATFEEIIEFFEQAGWGTLTVEEEKKQEVHLTLSSELITYRNQQKKNVSYQLEAGFLAMQIQQQIDVIAETYEELSKRGDKVKFQVKWDLKDPITRR
ncbi:YslB family protein [Gottfriedia acidiceleris]|uniref:YslB family protein n=1 Tax=Gottfriedia acidiceleris TaxID=371036 RepID=A0ABY4JS94_9BACI|nr:YslB family protein [Gottfriedia acidiceleris]UPM55190.1 YslB family protein [Gottfriedia acidiceleris]